MRFESTLVRYDWLRHTRTVSSLEILRTLNSFTLNCSHASFVPHALCRQAPDADLLLCKRLHSPQVSSLRSWRILSFCQPHLAWIPHSLSPYHAHHTACPEATVKQTSQRADTSLSPQSILPQATQDEGFQAGSTRHSAVNRIREGVHAYIMYL